MPYRLILPVLLALALVTLMATSPGYPDRSTPQHRAESSGLVRRLNEHVGAFRSDIEQLQLLTRCRLLLDPVDDDPVSVDLLALDVQPGSDRSSGQLELYLKDEATGGDWLLLATDSWPVWTAARSAINQLRARCARHTRPPVPAAPALPAS